MIERPDVTLVSIDGKSPQIADSAFIAPGCRLIGDVHVGEEASIWYNCVVRADVDRVVIGMRSNIQDGSVVHCDLGVPTIIGEDVLIGHMAIVHGCTLMDRAFVGLGAIVMNGCIIEGDAMLAAGALLTERKHILTGELWGGRPAAKMRDLPEKAIMGMRMGTAHYVENAKRHRTAMSSHSLPPKHP